MSKISNINAIANRSDRNYEFMLADLARSLLTPDKLRVECDPASTKAAFAGIDRVAEYRILYADLPGQSMGFYRTRLDREKNKYMQAPGSGIALYATSLDRYLRWQGSSIKFLVEGEKKTVCTLEYIGDCLEAVGLSGCWNFISDGVLLAPLFNSIREGDEVYVVLDSDIKTNPKVRAAAVELYRAITSKNAQPHFLVLPSAIDKEGKICHVGIDDWIVERLKRAKPPTPQQIYEELIALPQWDARMTLATSHAEFAAALLDDRFTDPVHGARTLIRWRESFYRYMGYHWIPMNGAGPINKIIYAELDIARPMFGESSPAKGNKGHKEGVIDALRAEAEISQITDEGLSNAALQDMPPFWIGTIPYGMPEDHTTLIAARNGIVDIATGRLWPCTPALFNLASMDFDFDPKARAPRWDQFLVEVYPNDRASIALLQEWMGYVFTMDTRQQKIMMIVGPKRSGKGAIGRVIKQVVGVGCVEPPLSMFGKQFGIQSLIGKSVAFVTDARIGSSSDLPEALQNLLRISGEDGITTDRKNQDAWTGRIRTRIMLATNTLLRLPDAGGALRARLLVLSHEVSFYEREDFDLERKLNAELPGITNWAIAGYQRLIERGHFVQPATGAAVLKDLERIMDPMRTFFIEFCRVKMGALLATDRLYCVYQKWSEEQHRDRILDKNHFASAIRTASDGKAKPGVRTKAGMHFENIELTEAAVELLSENPVPGPLPKKHRAKR